MKKISLKKALIYLGVGLVATASIVPISILTSCSSNQGNDKQDTNKDESLKPDQENNQNQGLDEGSGIYNGLQVSSYIGVVKQLDLKQETDFFSLSSQNLTAKLHENEKFNKLSLTILDDSNDKDGILKLKLSGEFDNKPIDNKEILISNFNKKAQSFHVSSIKLNLDNWFKNKQPINSDYSVLKNLTTDQNIINSLVKEANFKIGSKNFSLESIKNSYQITSIKMSSKDKGVNFDFVLSTKTNNYENGKWVQQDLNLSQETNSSKYVQFPSIEDLFNVIISQVTPDENEIKKYYPSFFQAKLKQALLLGNNKSLVPLVTFNNSNQIIPQYADYWKNVNTQYTPGIVLVANDISDIDANDKSGDLSYTLSMELDPSNPNYKASKKYSLKCKSSTNFIEENKTKQNTVLLIPKEPDYKKSNAKEIIEKQLKTVINNSITSNSSTKAIFNTSGIKKQIFTPSIAENENNQFSFNSYELELFGLKVKSFGGYDNPNGVTLNTNSGLFSSNGKLEDGFFINGITLDIESNVQANIDIKESSGRRVAEVTYEAKFVFTLSGYSEPLELPVVFKLQTTNIQ